MVEQWLRAELAGLEELRQLLQQEYDALRTRNVADLERLASEKQASADRLRELDRVRADCLLKQGLSADRQGLDAWVNTAPTREARAILHRLLADLERAADQARDQNEINGTIIATSRSQIEQILAILGGREPLEFLYGHDSRKVFSSGSGSSIAKA